MQYNTDIDECDSDPCHANAVCTNDPGSYSCVCMTGYFGNGTSCTGMYMLRDVIKCYHKISVQFFWWD